MGKRDSPSDILALIVVECYSSYLVTTYTIHLLVEADVMPTATKTRLKSSPLADRVAIRPMKEPAQMKGGLYIPDTAKEKPIQGEVIAVGPGRSEQGERVPMELKVGDRVVYGKYSGTQVELEGEEIILIKEADVIARSEERRVGKECRSRWSPYH